MKPADKLVKEGKHFCVLPWIHFHGWPNGQVMPCCVADSTKPVAQISDEISIIDMMNSDGYKEVRRKMMNDEPVEACNRCYQLEEAGTWTMRKSHNMRRGEECIDIIEDTNMDGSLDEFELRYMDIRFSNLCNMKCRSCGPSCSNLWGEEKAKQMGSTEDMLEVFDLTSVLTNSNHNGVFMEKLKPYLNTVQECYFAGGEILVTPEHYECLDYWVENGLTDQVELNYTTNMSKLTYKDKQGTRDLFDYWKQFDHVEIWASLDTLGDEAEIVRAGTKWPKVVENLRRIRDEAPNIKLGFTPTISMWNIFSYHKLFDFLEQENLIDMNYPPRLNMLTHPDYANIKYLPKHIAQKLKKLYFSYELKYDTYKGKSEALTHMKNTFGILCYTLDNVEPNPHKLLEFKHENEILDQLRDEKLVDAVPELQEVFEWAQNELSQ